MPMEKLSLLLMLVIFFVQVYSNDVKLLFTQGHYYSQYFSLKDNLTPNGTLYFAVKTQSDAQILLSPSHEVDEPVYEIVLGAHNNTLNYIRGRCSCKTEPDSTVKLENLLNPKEFRTFWARIRTYDKKTFVEVGVNDSVKPFIQWRDKRPLLPLFLSFRSAFIAEWQYGFNDSNYNSGISKDRQQSIVTATNFGQYFLLSEVVDNFPLGITLYFTVKTNKAIQILLSPSVNALENVYIINIGNTYVYLKKCYGCQPEEYAYSGTLSKERKKLRYWIKLTFDGYIRIGQGDSSKSFFKWHDLEPVIPQYLSFTLAQEQDQDVDSNFADVQFGFGPNYTMSRDCSPMWKQSTGKLPLGLIRGGIYHEQNTFICRSQYQGYIVPGYFILNEEKCFIAHHDKFIVQTRFAVLTGCNFKWIPSSRGHIPKGSIEGGRSTPSERQMYFLVKVKYGDEELIGRISPGYQVASAAYDGDILFFDNYEMLVQMTDSTTTSTDVKTKLPS